MSKNYKIAKKYMLVAKKAYDGQAVKKNKRSTKINRFQNSTIEAVMEDKEKVDQAAKNDDLPAD